VIYEVTFTNNNTATVALDRITDTLPAGFDFLYMAAGDEVGDPDDDVEPEIVWTGATVPAGGSLTMRYTVEATDQIGEYRNSVEAVAGGQTIGPASATVQIGSRVFLPFVAHSFGSSPPGAGLPFREDFTNGVPADWVPFTNWPDLSPDHWYWAGTMGVYGVYNYDFQNPTLYQSYHIAIYDGSGAQSWTDYRIEARVKDVKEKDLKRGLVGIWFRGKYQDSGLKDGKTVGGYYVYMKVADDSLYLMHTPADNPAFNSRPIVDSKANPGGRIGRKHWYKIIIEVRGNTIKVWFEDDADGVDAPLPIFDWTDPDATWQAGTVGLAVCKTDARFDYIHVEPLE